MTGRFSARAAAPVTIDESYFSPIQNHVQMEPCATIAWWEGDKVTVHTSIQMVKGGQHALPRPWRSRRATCTC